MLRGNRVQRGVYAGKHHRLAFAAGRRPVSVALFPAQCVLGMQLAYLRIGQAFKVAKAALAQALVSANGGRGNTTVAGNRLRGVVGAA